MNTLDMLDVLDTRRTRDTRTQDTTTIGHNVDRTAETGIAPLPSDPISYRLIRTTASAFPIYVDAHAPGPHPPALSPLITGTGSTR